MKLERLYTVPLGEAYEAVRQKRVPKAVKLLRAFIERHMKAKGMKITFSKALNEHLWAHSIQKPPRRVKVRLIKDDDAVRAYLSDEKVEEPKKKEEKKGEEKKPQVKEEAKKVAPAAVAKPAEKKPEVQGPKPVEKKPEAQPSRPEAKSPAIQNPKPATPSPQKPAEQKPSASQHQSGSGEKR